MARDTSFYYAFLMLPPAKRNAIVVVWDFCRAVDDAVDEVAEADKWPLEAAARETAERELALWRSEVARCFDTTGALGVPQTRQGKALRPLVETFGLPRQPFDDLIDGVEMDLSKRPLRDDRRAARILPPRGVRGWVDLHRDLRLP